MASATLISKLTEQLWPSINAFDYQLCHHFACLRPSVVALAGKAHTLLPLPQSKALHAVKGAKVFGFDNVNAALRHLCQ